MWIFLGDDFWIYFRVQRFLVRQWIHVFFHPVYGGFRTRILRSILVLLSCSVFAAKSTGFGFGATFGPVLLVSTPFAQCSLLLFPNTMFLYVNVWDY